MFLDRVAELERISLPSLPHKDCRAFYVSGWSGQENLGGFADIYAHNVSAMLIAQFAGIPTVNGFASFNPPGVNFSRPNASDYEQRIYNYAKRHRISNLCKLDLNSKIWSFVRDGDIDMAYMHVPFLNETNWSGRILDAQGLSSFESWGTWSIAKTVVFEFNIPLPESFNLHLTARAFGSNIGKDFEARVGDDSTKFRITGVGDARNIIPVDNPTRSNLLTISVPNPISPKVFSQGQSPDDRNLGIGFVEMKIVPVKN
ncbi:hypothetical protein CDA09_23120 [Azoarcus sp. DN11]|nr:hypothetical protein CDA09_23120 [Azoarcus sp. DN11]